MKKAYETLDESLKKSLHMHMKELKHTTKNSFQNHGLISKKMEQFWDKK